MIADLLLLRLLAFGRLLRRHAFLVLLLGPIIGGGILWIAERWSPFVRAALAGEGMARGTSLGLVLLLTLLYLPSTGRELFPPWRRAPGAALEVLPIPERTRFIVSGTAVLGHHAGAFLGLLLLLGVLGEEPMTAGRLASLAHELAAALAVTALLGLVLAQLGPRLRHLSRGARRTLAAVAVTAAGGAVAAGAGAFVLLPWWVPATRVEAALRHLGGLPPRAVAAAGPWPWVLEVALLGCLALVLFLRYRRRDLENAAAGAGRERRMAERLREIVRPGRWLRSPLLELLGRDLLLVARRFSPAVDFAAVLALVILAVVFGVLPGLELSSFWLRRLLVLGSGLAVATLVALVPLLFKHQLSRLWIERSTAVDFEDVWRAKLGLALCLALPPFALAALGVWTLDGATAVLHLAGATWILASLIGLGAFEIAAAPVLGLALSAVVGFALAAVFVIYPQLWWVVAILYLWAAGQLAERAPRLLRLMEVER